MGIDYGTKRIGIAISDPKCTMALPLETIQVTSDNSHMQRIKEVAQAYSITHIVVGLPYNMDGSLGESARNVMQWTEQLNKLLELPVEFWDERLSTSEAHDLLLDIDVNGRKRKKLVDKIAASIILKEYIDTRLS
ncbi:MAG: Holliday junction resolvase RuvX [Deltaproteobacteria bacterium]|nr:Holliday junction resolvase RuvX [Deltaproteobacteria bacterium]